MAKKLTPEDHDRIIEMKLNRVPVRSIAQEIDCSPRIVQDHWNRYLADTAAERAARAETLRVEAVARLEQIAADCRLGALRTRAANQHTNCIRYLNAERATLVAIAQIEGVGEPLKVEHSGTVEVSPAEEQQKAIDVVRRLRAVS